MEVLTLEESEGIIGIYTLLVFNFEGDGVERGMIGYEGILWLGKIFDHCFSLFFFLYFYRFKGKIKIVMV